MLEPEVYAAGVRSLNKILELGPIAGLHYKVNRNHDIVRNLGLDPKFVGAVPPELLPKTRTQLLET